MVSWSSAWHRAGETPGSTGGGARGQAAGALSGKAMGNAEAGNVECTFVSACFTSRYAIVAELLAEGDLTWPGFARRAQLT